MDQCGESYSLDGVKSEADAWKTCPYSTPKCYGHVSNKNWGVCAHSTFNNSGRCAYDNKDKDWKTKYPKEVPVMCPETAPKCVGYEKGTNWGHCTHSNFDNSSRCAYDYQDKDWRTKYKGEMPIMCPISKPNCIGYKPGTNWGQCELYPDQ